MKRKLFTFMFILSIIFITGIVQAADFTLTPKPAEVTIKPEEEFTITLAISNIDLGENGMQTVEGVLNYDKNIFEEITQSNVTASGNWSVTYNDENTELNGKFLAMVIGKGATTDQDIISIKFTAKKEIEPQTTTITIEKIASNDGTTLIEEANKEIKVVIQGNENGNTNENNNDSNNNNADSNNAETNNNNNGNTNENNNNGNVDEGRILTIKSSEEEKTSTTSTEKNLPYTGTKEKYILISSIVIVLVGIGSFIAYKKLKNI